MFILFQTNSPTNTCDLGARDNVIVKDKILIIRAWRLQYHVSKKGTLPLKIVIEYSTTRVLTRGCHQTNNQLVLHIP